MEKLLHEISKCTICADQLPFGSNPVVRASAESQIVIVGQAPGRRVHESNIPWNDPSGDRLRDWLAVSKEQFYDTKLFALIPMAFCYPGTGKNGDNPPPKACAPQWHVPLYDSLKSKPFTLLVGQYAQKHYLQKKVMRNLTQTVQGYEEYLPDFLPLPHPSPRNNIWMKKNRWFEEEVLPVLQQIIHHKISNHGQ
ncbi:uracil-DNA glycosylase family protein [Jiulongibacter sp. NS-SX5]|uniref:uracil-DNA glycosylase family protein n=1 Tax=Jiulongibacter sp. NS-SX5 TaxID=3463854 RepID=UPI00405A0685